MTTTTPNPPAQGTDETAGQTLSLDSYRLLGSSGLWVSPLALGTMTFGSDWGWGADRDQTKEIFDAYVGRGGNFIDTANVYTNGTAEQMVGEFARSRRDQLVIATKYTMPTRPDDPNSGGNSRQAPLSWASPTRLSAGRLHALAGYSGRRLILARPGPRSSGPGRARRQTRRCHLARTADRNDA